jgi:hypothetical protein
MQKSYWSRRAVGRFEISLSREICGGGVDHSTCREAGKFLLSIGELFAEHGTARLSFGCVQLFQKIISLASHLSQLSCRNGIGRSIPGRVG